MKLIIELNDKTVKSTLFAAVTMAVLTCSLVGSAGTDDFADGEVLTAEMLNRKFEALESQLPKPPVFSGSSGFFKTDKSEPVPIPNNMLSLTTTGGVVRLELAPSPTFANSRVWISGAGTGSDPYWTGYIRFQRSSDGAEWKDLTSTDFGGYANLVGTTCIPPGAFSFYDDPAAGTWSYRVVVNRHPTQADGVIHVDNVRLVVRELAVAKSP